MADLYPFRGFRFDPAKVGKLGDIVTQPYDKIPDDLLQDYLARSPYNVAHVIKNRDYKQAGRFFQDWIDRQLLRQDPEATFYPYEQVFRVGDEEVSRLGFVGLSSLRDSDLAIRGHETVLDAPLQDRLSLIRETESNDGLIFSLFSDPSMKIDRLLEAFRRSETPVAEVVDDFQVSHRLWCMRDPGSLQAIVEAFRPLTIYIADGHHRFETAVRYAAECRRQGWSPAAVESFDKRMMAFFNMESPGIRILPTHRAIRGLREFQLNSLLSRVEPFFEVSELSGLEELDREMSASARSLGLVSAQPSGIFHLCLKGDDPSFLPGISGPARRLDVNMLHRGILEPHLGIGEEELEKQSHVDYYRSREEMLERLRQGRYQLAFLLNPTRLDQVREISEAGERMPQKSTDFFPKLATGLVFMKMEIDRKEVRT